MKKIGYYYSKQLETLIMGFEDEKGNLIGKVIGHTCDDFFVAFRYGYRYNRWHEGFVYVGKLTTYTTLKGYLDFLEEADYDQIKSYFLSKPIVLEQHDSYVKRRVINGRTYRYNLKKEKV